MAPFAGTKTPTRPTTLKPLARMPRRHMTGPDILLLADVTALRHQLLEILQSDQRVLILCRPGRLEQRGLRQFLDHERLPYFELGADCPIHQRPAWVAQGVLDSDRRILLTAPEFLATVSEAATFFHTTIWVGYIQAQGTTLAEGCAEAREEWQTHCSFARPRPDWFFVGQF